MKNIVHILAPMVAKAIDEETLWARSVAIVTNIIDHDIEITRIRRELRTKISEMIADIERQIQ